MIESAMVAAAELVLCKFLLPTSRLLLCKRVVSYAFCYFVNGRFLLQESEGYELGGSISLARFFTRRKSLCISCGSVAIMGGFPLHFMYYFLHFVHNKHIGFHSLREATNQKPRIG